MMYIPGIKAEDSKSLGLAGSSGHVDIFSQLNVKDGKNIRVDNGDIYSKNKKVLKIDDQISFK